MRVDFKSVVSNIAGTPRLDAIPHKVQSISTLSYEKRLLPIPRRFFLAALIPSLLANQSNRVAAHGIKRPSFRRYPLIVSEAMKPIMPRTSMGRKRLSDHLPLYTLWSYRIP
jgi:hypothetical protein